MTARTFTFTVNPASPAWSRAVGGGQLADFAVRSLTTVSNGKPRLASATLYSDSDGAIPGEWNTWAAYYGSSATFAAWSGGRGDATNRRLLVTGGGHTNGANNGVYCYDFGFGDTPIGWRLVGAGAGTLGGYDATPASNTSSLTSLSTLYDGTWSEGSMTVYTDNRPTSVHTYDQMAYDPNLDRFYRFSGAPYVSGANGMSVGYYLDMATGLWNSNGTGSAFVSNLPGQGNSSSLVASADGSKLLYMPSATGGNFTFYSSTGALLGTSGATGIPGGYGGAVTATYSTRSTTADKILLVYSTNANGNYLGPTAMYELEVNWNTYTVTKSSDKSGLYSNATYLGTDRGGGSVFHDALNSCYWMFGTYADTHGLGTANMGTQILKILDHTQANPYEISAETMGTAISQNNPGSAYPYGSFNRHVWFPSLRVVATVQNINEPMSVIRIPGAQS